MQYKGLLSLPQSAHNPQALKQAPVAGFGCVPGAVLVGGCAVPENPNLGLGEAVVLFRLPDGKC